MSQARDNILAGITYGARGGLGMTTGTGPVTYRADQLISGVVEGGNAPPIKPPIPGGGGGGTPPPLPKAPAPTATGKRFTVAQVAQPQVRNIITDPAYPGTAPPAYPLPLPLPPPGKTTTVTITTGGATTGTGGGNRVQTAPPPMAPVPEVDISSSKPTPWLLIALAAGGAYLLWRGRHDDGDS